jgi:hypothetical protein
MFNALDSDSMSLLLANEKPAIGVPFPKTLKYYIDRDFECKKYVELRYENESEIQKHFGKGTQDVQHPLETLMTLEVNIETYKEIS